MALLACCRGDGGCYTLPSPRDPVCPTSSQALEVARPPSTSRSHSQAGCCHSQASCCHSQASCCHSQAQSFPMVPGGATHSSSLGGRTAPGWEIFWFVKTVTRHVGPSPSAGGHSSWQRGRVGLTATTRPLGNGHTGRIGQYILSNILIFTEYICERGGLSCCVVFLFRLYFYQGLPMLRPIY